MPKFFTYLFLLLFFSFPVSAEIYKWVDKQGKAHFTDKLPTNKKTEEITLKINTYSAVQVKPLVERLGRKDKVVIYSTTRCGYCKKAKKYFRKNNIAYVDYDVEKSRTGKRDYKLLKGKAVPIIIIGDKRMNGFSATRFEAVYQKYLKEKKAKIAEKNEQS